MDTARPVKSKYILYLDILRIAATVMVVVRHVASYNWYNVGTSGAAWYVTAAINSFAQCAVPIFVMISGALFLDNDKPLPLKKLLLGNLLPIVVTLAVWSLAYSTVLYFRGVTFVSAVGHFFMGHYHLWYLYMLIPLYLIVPLLRRITASKRLTEYFLVIGFVMSFLLPRIILALKYFKIPIAPEIIGGLDVALKNTFFEFTGGYVIYFLLGFYIHKHLRSVILQRLCCILSLGCVTTFYLTVRHTAFANEASIAFLDNHSIPVLCTAVGLFLLSRVLSGNAAPGDRAVRVMRRISKITFGVYLVHPAFLEIIGNYIRFDTLIRRSLISLPIVALLVIVLSFAVSAVLNCIPFVKKYIV